MTTSACDRQVGKLLPQRTSERKRRICATDQGRKLQKPMGYQWVEEVYPQPLFRVPNLFNVSAGGLQTAMRRNFSSFLRMQTSVKVSTASLASLPRRIWAFNHEEGTEAWYSRLKYLHAQLRRSHDTEENIIGSLGKDTRSRSKCSIKVEPVSLDG